MFTYVDSSSALSECLNQIQKGDTPFISFDTEFERRTTYFPKVALIQLFANNLCFLIDPLKVDITPLKSLWSNSAIKVVHSGKQDIEIIWQEYNCPVTPLFDTQIAAALCGYGEGLGYNKLVEIILGQHLSKSQQKTNWLKRPLTKSQLTYAEKDVVFLGQAFPIIRDKLIEMNRLEWLYEIQNRFYDASHFHVNPHKAWLKIHPTSTKWEFISVLIDLSLCREELAIASNMHRLLVIPDQIIQELAIKRSPDYEVFLASCVIHKPLMENEASLNDIHKAYTQALENLTDDSKRQMVEEKINKHLMRKNIPTTILHKQGKLRKFIQSKAAELNIPHYYLGEKNEIENFVENPSRDHPFLTTWRANYLGEICEGILKG